MNIDPGKKDVPKNMYMRSIRSSGVGNRPPRKEKKCKSGREEGMPKGGGNRSN